LHGVFLHDEEVISGCACGPRHTAGGLHPENAPEVFVDFPRAMALSAPCEELSHL
jgi:hypothetical protein